MHKLVSDCDDLATALAEMETMYETQQALTGTTEVGCIAYNAVERQNSNRS